MTGGSCPCRGADLRLKELLPCCSCASRTLSAVWAAVGKPEKMALCKALSAPKVTVNFVMDLNGP